MKKILDAFSPLANLGRTEAEISQHIRLALGQLPDLVLWRNQVGRYKHDGRWITYGLCPGSSDLIGILKPSGRWFCLEVKAKKGTLSKEQAMFMNLIRGMGGVAECVRSVEEAMNVYRSNHR